MIGTQEAVQWFSLVVLITSYRVATSERQPNIVFILADDLGWNDVGFHGSGQIPTPNIDALAYSGIILNNYYVSPICTPSRSALMTGKHPINTGMQHGVLKCAEPRGLPLKEKLLPEYLRELGYSTHIVGKWHLGFYTKEYTPTYRGFDSHLGFWSGHQDYFDHTAVEGLYWGLDMRRGLEPAWDLHGQYSTDIFTKEAEKLIDAHNTSRPMFLYLAHAAVHSGNQYNPLPVLDAEVAKFSYIQDRHRRQYAGMLSKLDESVGRVVEALRKKDMLQNSVIVFSTDNGGPPAGFNLNAASNWPLRGAKNTLWEGGVRGAAFMWSAKLLPQPGRIAWQMFHITDWLPTLLDAAGGNPSDLDIDGVNLWESLKNNAKSPRKSILHNIDNSFGISAITMGDFKLIQGSTYEGLWDGWYGPSGREWAYEVPRVINSVSAQAVASIGMELVPEEIRKLQSSVMIKCPPRNETLSACKPLEAPCLFNIGQDPCESNNIATLAPEIVSDLWKEIQRLNDSSVPPGNLPWDQRANPIYWDHTWTNFGDYLNAFQRPSVEAM